jgi:hypothetical protein
MGNESSAEDYAREVTSIVDEMGRPDYMTKFYSAYVMLGDVSTADGLASRLLVRELRPSRKMAFHRRMNQWLSEAGSTYDRFGHGEAFRQLCQKIENGQGEEPRDAVVNTLRPKPAEQLDNFPRLEFEDTFGSDTLSTQWDWVDPDGTSSYSLYHNPDRMEISAVSGSQLVFTPYTAPRLSQSISGDFAIETRMEGERLGGLFMLNDEEDAITIQRWPFIGKLMVSTWRNEVTDRAFLNAETLVLRMERKGDRVDAYYSGDGKNWYRLIWMHGIGQNVQVGIFASCPEDAARAVTSFYYVRIFGCPIK